MMNGRRLRDCDRRLKKQILLRTSSKYGLRHTLYIPAGVIHSNDYLKGTWRTMLSDGPVDHAHLYRGPAVGDIASQFHFTFQ